MTTIAMLFILYDAVSTPDVTAVAVVVTGATGGTRRDSVDAYDSSYRSHHRPVGLQRQQQQSLSRLVFKFGT